MTNQRKVTLVDPHMIHGLDVGGGLYVVSGRVPGDDEDVTFTLCAKDEEDAHTGFHELLADLRNCSPERLIEDCKMLGEDAPYITCTTLIGQVQPKQAPTFDPEAPSKRMARCNHHNELQAALGIELKSNQWLSVTYGCHLRLGLREEDSFLETKGLPESICVSIDEPQGARLFLHLYHGRDTLGESMNDWGDDARGEKDYPGDPTADAFVITKAGINVVNYNTDGTYTETLLPYVNDLIEYRGKYYGDFSIEWVGSEGHVPAKES